ncbi:MAG: soluble lytic murein transglycosylase, partial [Myxococcota bacterium]
TEFSKWTRANPNDPNVGRGLLLLGAAHLYNGAPGRAAPVLVRARKRLPELQDYCRLLAARAWLRSRKPAAALSELKGIRSGFVQARAVSLLKARALVQLGKPRAAIKAYQAHLVRYPNSGASVYSALAGVHHARRDKKKAAAALRQIMARAPHTKHSRAAERKLKKLPRKYRRLRRAELLVRIRAQYDGRKYRQVIKTSRTLLRAYRKGSAGWCEAGYLKARALERSKKRTQALPVYGAVVGACKKRIPEKLMADILYFGGKRQLESGIPARAAAWFKRIHKVAPKHSYIDDTYIHLAEVARSKGDHSTADKSLAKAIGHGGDMQEQAAFELFFRHYEAGRYRRAAIILEEALEKVPSAQLLKQRGRLVYWLARALERSGQRVRAAVVYTRTVREYPLAWYSSLALARLEKMDPSVAKDAVRAAKAVRPVTSITDRNARHLANRDVKRAVDLMRLGLHRYAKAEIAALDPALGPDVDWLVAHLYARSGDQARAYRIARFRRPEYQTSWPAKGHEEHWRLAHPRPARYAAPVRRFAAKFGVDEALVWSVMRSESAFDSDALSIANAVGLMQLIVPTGKAMARQDGVRGRVDKQRLREPVLNIRLGSRYLGKLGTRFDGHPALIAAGYNAGPGGPMKWLRQRRGQELDQFVENIPYRETRKYVKSVVTSWLRYRALYSATEGGPRLTLRLPRIR